MRRLLWLIPLAVLLAADAAKDTTDAVATAATELSAGRPAGFIEAFDPSMPGYEKLRDAVTGLTAEANLTCAIDVVSNEGDEGVRTLTLDWVLLIEHKDANPSSARREKRVKCELRKTGKKWRITSFEPLDLFAPMK